MNIQFTVTGCPRVVLLSSENNYFVNYNQYRLYLGMKGLREHPTGWCSITVWGDCASYTSCSPLQQTLLKETTFVLADKKGDEIILLAKNLERL